MDITLEQPVRARLVTLEDAGCPAAATLRYTSRDPLAIHMDFPAELSLTGADITWSFARDLLWAGLTAVVGEGDVHIWPCARSTTVLEFYGADGMALVEFERDVLHSFLLRTYAAVAMGQEDVGPAIDSCLSALMGGV
ncbi:SsgA family sporulation/cell division regulator [Streptomyces sp. NPDC007205]|uniref:SsgA family sporulation/cell division regulator n=1 Tax=Streptomyces sp. NPDC007205 TaxID=3154316 RepID=UPI0033C7539B